MNTSLLLTLQRDPSSLIKFTPTCPIIRARGCVCVVCGSVCICVCRLCSPYSVCVRVYVWGMLLTVWDIVWKAPISVYWGLHKRKNINTTIAAKAFATLVLSGFHQWSQNNTRVEWSFHSPAPPPSSADRRINLIRSGVFPLWMSSCTLRSFRKQGSLFPHLPSSFPLPLLPFLLFLFPSFLLSLYWQANQRPCTYTNYAKSLELLVCLFCVFVFPK